MNKKILASAILIVLFTSGCATIVRGTEQDVSINTNPVGANIQFSNGQSCSSPCTIKTKRNQALQISVTKDGCHQQTATMMPTLAGGGVIMGGLIDYGTGAVYDLQPNPMTISLVCDNLNASSVITTIKEDEIQEAK